MTNYTIRYLRKILKNKLILVCPSCQSECSRGSYEQLEFYSAICGICNTPLGFVTGFVKARKLGSYIRLRHQIYADGQISIDISSFGDNFDVRKGDYITLIYQLNCMKGLPVMLVNHTINEVYYMQAFASNSLGGKAHVWAGNKTESPIDLSEYETKTHQFTNDFGSKQKYSEREFMDLSKKLKWVNSTKVLKEAVEKAK